MSDLKTEAAEQVRLSYEELHRRAQGWPTHRRLRKLQEECGELTAAINRYLENPSAYLREKLAEELVGTRTTLCNVEPDFEGDCDSVRPRQAFRFRAALERDGL